LSNLCKPDTLLPMTALSDLTALLQSLDRVEAPAERLAVDPALVALSSRSEAIDVEVPGLNGSLLDYQTVAVQYALSTRRCIIGDQMGLGKTPTAIATLLTAGTYPALVVVPPSLRTNWSREIARFAPGLRVEILSGTKVPAFLPPADVYVIGDSTLKAWQPLLQTAGLQALIVDEAHRMKERNTQRSQATLALAKSVPASGLVILLTGTAIVNRPVELLSPLNIIGRTAEVFGSSGEYLNRYCGPRPVWTGYKQVTVYDGAENLAELNERLRGTCYVRRNKDQVDLGLLPKDRNTVVLDLNGELAEYRKAERDFLTWVRETRGDAAARGAANAETIARMGALKRLVGAAKVKATCDYVQEMLDQDEQVIVFGWHRDVTEAIAAHFSAPMVVGGMTDAAKAKACDDFQAGRARVIVGNIDAMGVGLTLTAARCVVFAEQHWTPGQHEQAEDRAHRYTQTRQVLVRYMVAAGTIDEYLRMVLDAKAEVVRAVLDGKVDAAAAEQGVFAEVLELLAG
jgi:SWI/SNF-related matrix-associated actin-dependent regulator 1 of chromatin subfamily A